MSSATSSALQFRPAETRDQLHPWIRALEVFGIPFLCYAIDGRRIHTSLGARELLQNSSVALAVERQAEQAIVKELGWTHPQPQIGQFALVREVTNCAAAIVLAVHLIRPAANDVSAVLVFRPYVAERMSEAQTPGLTRRQGEIARLVAAGLPTKEIAQRLGISSHTTRHHTERVFAKLCVRSRAGLAALLATRSTP
jgi:DNA-binding CsgD family transcriptional regulator